MSLRVIKKGGAIMEKYIKAIKETWIFDGKYISGESGWYEPYTDKPGDLFRSLKREYGLCSGRMYRDSNGQQIACGWVFRKRKRAKGTVVTLETWVECRYGYRLN